MTDALRDVRTSAGELIWAAVFLVVDFSWQTTPSGAVRRAVQEGLLTEVPMVVEFDAIPDEIGAVLFIVAFARLARVAAGTEGRRALVHWLRFLVVASVALLITSIDAHFVRERGTAADFVLGLGGLAQLVAFVAAPWAMAALCRRFDLERANACWERTLALFGGIIAFVVVLILVALAGFTGRVQITGWFAMPIILVLMVGMGFAWIGSCVVTRREVDARIATRDDAPAGHA